MYSLSEPSSRSALGASHPSQWNTPDQYTQFLPDPVAQQCSPVEVEYESAKNYVQPKSAKSPRARVVGLSRQMIETLSLSRSQACHNCRNRKLRCDEQRPICSSCLTFGTDYQYISEATSTKRNFEDVASMITRMEGFLTHEIQALRTELRRSSISSDGRDGRSEQSFCLVKHLNETNYSKLVESSIDFCRSPGLFVAL